jgi:hypothetical protein
MLAAARLKPCPDETLVVAVVFASERGFGSAKSRSLAALGMTAFCDGAIEMVLSTFI